MKRVSIRPVVLVAATLMVAGCGDQDHNDQEPRSAEARLSAPAEAASPPPSLVNPSPIVIPGLDEETDWLGRVQDLKLDIVTGNLLALDSQASRVVEFAATGDFRTAYGGMKGGGPEEIRRLAGFAFNDSIVVLLDVGNSKILVYSREGEFRRMVPAAPTYRDIALHGSRLLYVPGIDGDAVDVRELDGPQGERVMGLGSVEDLPVRCNGNECTRLRRLCTGCEIVAVNDSLFVITNLEQSMIATFTWDGERRDFVDLLVDHPVLRRWHEQDAAFIEEANAESGGRTVTLKTYFFGFEPIGRWAIGSAVAPSGPVFRERGYEYWIIDLRTWKSTRFSFPDGELGLRAAGVDPVYALNRTNGGIYRLEMPASGDTFPTEHTTR